jgi:hypothetical protein
MEKVLVFRKNNAKNYWFKYLINFLADKNINFNAHIDKSEIIFGDNKLKFISQYDAEKYSVGKHDCLFISDMEYRFEKDFEGVLIKILMEVNKNA